MKQVIKTTAGDWKLFARYQNGEFIGSPEGPDPYSAYEQIP